MKEDIKRRGEKEENETVETGRVESVSAQPDGTIKREVKEVEVKQPPRTESGPTGTVGEGDRTDKDGWLVAGMADDRYSRNPDGFVKEDRTKFESGRPGTDDE